MRSTTSTRAAAAVAFAAVLSIAALPALAADGSNSWTQYRNGPTNNAVISSEVEDIYTGSLETPDAIRATPVIADGKVFIGNHGVGDMQAFDLSTGEKLWHVDGMNWIHSEMIYSEGRLYVGLGHRFNPPEGEHATDESGVLALDAKSGEKLWWFETELEVMPTPALVGDSLYFVTGDKHLFEVDPASGEQRSVTDLAGIVSMSSPSVENGMLYFGTGSPAPYTFYAYDTETDEVAWTTELDQVITGLDDVSPAVSNGIIVTTANTAGPADETGEQVDEHRIFGLDSDTGEVLWQDSLGTGPKPSNNRSGAPTIADGRVFVGSPTTNTAYAYDLETGKRLWSFPTGGIKGAPVAKDGTVYFGTKSGWIYAFDIETGKKIGEKHLGGTLAPAGPILVNDVLIAGSQDHNVYLTPISDVLGESDAPTWPVVVIVTLGILVILLAVIVVLQARRLRTLR